MNTSQLSIVMMALFFLVNYLPAMLGISNKDLREILRNQVSQFEMQGEIEKAIKCAGDLIELDRNSNDNFNLAKSLELMGDLKRKINKWEESTAFFSEWKKTLLLTKPIQRTIQYTWRQNSWPVDLEKIFNNTIQIIHQEEKHQQATDKGNLEKLESKEKEIWDLVGKIEANELSKKQGALFEEKRKLLGDLNPKTISSARKLEKWYLKNNDYERLAKHAIYFSQVRDSIDDLFDSLNRSETRYLFKSALRLSSHLHAINEIFYPPNHIKVKESLARLNDARKASGLDISFENDLIEAISPLDSIKVDNQFKYPPEFLEILKSRAATLHKIMGNDSKYTLNAQIALAREHLNRGSQVEGCKILENIIKPIGIGFSTDSAVFAESMNLLLNSKGKSPSGKYLNWRDGPADQGEISIFENAYREFVPANHWKTYEFYERKKVLEKINSKLSASENFLKFIVNDNNYSRQKPHLELKLFKEMLDAASSICGNDSIYYFDTLSKYAAILDIKGDHDRSLSLHKQALDGLKKTAGESSLRYRKALQRYIDYLNTIVVDENYNDYMKRCYRSLEEAAGTKEYKSPGFKLAIDTNPKTIDISKTAARFARAGDYAKAEPIYQKLVLQLEKQHGKTHIETLAIKSDLGSLYADMGDFGLSEDLLKMVLEACITNYNNTSEHARALHNYGVLLDRMGKFTDAEPILRQDLYITKLLKLPNLFSLAQSQETLGWVLAKRGNHKEALVLYAEAYPHFMKMNIDMTAKARFLVNYGVVWRIAGDFIKSEELLLKGIEIYKTVFPSGHPEYAEGLSELAILRLIQKRPGESFGLLRQSLAMTRQHLQKASIAQTQRQQQNANAAFRKYLDLWITTAMAGQLSAAEEYQEVFSWKGSVFARGKDVQKNFNGALISRTKDSAERTGRQLASLVFRAQNGDNIYPGDITNALMEKERADRDLTEAVSAFYSKQPNNDVNIPNLKSNLKNGTVLVDFFEYTPYGSDQSHLRVYIANNISINVLALGPMSPIQEALKKCQLGMWGHKSQESANKLRKLIWEPLEPFIGQNKSILISPDSILAEIPFNALPGKNNQSFLLEEYQISICPVPQILCQQKNTAPSLLSTPDNAVRIPPNNDLGNKTIYPDNNSMLVIADVDYGHRENTDLFDRLPGTLQEVLFIRDMLEERQPDQDIRILRGTRPTKENLAWAIKDKKWLHFATHGYYKPPKEISNHSNLLNSGVFKSYEFHPDLFSGLALAGANIGMVATFGNVDDGILRANEICNLDLSRCDMVVLSACQTGKGKAFKGEGVLSMQRAFSSAGATSTIGTLWSVDDRATVELMKKFYSNFFDKNMSKVAALQAAQIWMLKEGWKDQTIQKTLRGIDSEEFAEISKNSQLPPFFWAAFTLAQ